MNVMYAVRQLQLLPPGLHTIVVAVAVAVAYVFRSLNLYFQFDSLEEKFHHKSLCD